MSETLQKTRQHLLSGVSFAIPFIAGGGILLAISFMFAPMTPTGPDFSAHPTLKLINTIGSASFALMLPILAGYISYAIANRPGLAPGFVGGYLCGEVNAGFIGALIIGLIAGYLVNALKKLPVPSYIKPVMPILIIPVISSLIVGVLILKVIGIPIAEAMQFLNNWLRSMGAGSKVLLAMILGGMIAFDMGGPINKAAFFFGAAMIKEGDSTMMGCIAAAICTPPLGMGLATLMSQKLWSEEQKEAGVASFVMGLVGITEGAIPFGAGDPLRIIPCLVLGSMVAATIAMLGGVGDFAPHGGPIVLPVVKNKLIYILAIIVGAIVTALCANFIKFLQKRKEIV